MTDNAHSRPFIYYLFFTALTCGAMIMVIEVLGSKVIGPVFGVSLFVWTSLITVTLVALSAGYAAGGYISDKKDHPDYLYGIIFVAGLLVILIPFAKSIVLRSCQPLGLRMGALTSSTILFGPSLFLLGCVSPYIIKVSARELRNIGRTVGVFYSISTVGSFL
ncbi:MAG: fused MFS/spermidine synthase, partial [Thermodesulfovibrionales bacterium]